MMALLFGFASETGRTLLRVFHVLKGLQKFSLNSMYITLQSRVGLLLCHIGETIIREDSGNSAIVGPGENKNSKEQNQKTEAKTRALL